ncbi:chloride channel protein 2-like [Trichomycterus rosablanca]|uniref:chloride channel protein 2-like n=1 Tax=Trichomycterus rosablanca TaxID=2290929 RepID=UPI002F35A696
MDAEDPEEKIALQSEKPKIHGYYTDDPKSQIRLRQRLMELKHPEQPNKNCSDKLTMFTPQWRKFLMWRFGEQWVFLILLAVIPGFLSWAMDFGIEFGLQSTRNLYELAHANVFLQYLAWISVPVVLIIFAAAFTYFVGPQAAGSGIPEIKPIVKGLKVHDHLSLKTLVAKLVGLTCALGSGMPLGKESPFVHIGGACAMQLSRLMSYISGVKRSEARDIEMVVVGSAVGIAACFSSPIGGLLYSIEVATSLLPVKCYWKGYFAATISAFVFRILQVWSGHHDTITPLFKTFYRHEYPYQMAELVTFTILGVLSGLAGALFVFLNGMMVRFIRSPRRISKFLVKTRVLYPAIVTLVIATLTFPPGFGQFMAGELTQRETLLALFDNHTWSKHLEADHFHEHDYSVAYKHPQVNVFVTLTIAFIMKLFMSAVAISMPVPCGAFVPAFVVGAGLGRLVGEVTAIILPEAVYANGTVYTVIPGSYALAGAAAMSGAATHTISTAVIVFELGGQINFLYPTIFSVIAANMVAQCLQPSLYDSLIRIRKIPYLSEPSMDHPDTSEFQVEDIMEKNVKYLTLTSTYRDLHNILLSKLQQLPLVKSAESMILLGSIECSQLHKLLSNQLSRSRRLECFKQGSQNDEQKVRNQTGGPVQLLGNYSGFICRYSQDSDINLRNLLCTHSTVAITEESDVDDPMSLTEIIEWEEQQLGEQVNFELCKIDPARVQILEHTSLHRVHNIFYMMSLDLAYVTSFGKLIGVVAHRELRKGAGDYVKERGIETHPPLVCFRESMTRLRKTTTPEATELRKLLGSQSNLNYAAP